MKKYIYIIIIYCLISNEPQASDKGFRCWSLYFTSPDNGIEAEKIENPVKALMRLIDRAQESFYGAFYDVSSEEVIRKLLLANNRGVNVKLVVEKDNIRQNGIELLRNVGIRVIMDDRSGLMHNKFAIIDGNIVWTGSYNVTDNGAYRNNNNAIEIHSTELAVIFLDEFMEMFQYGIFGNRKGCRVFSKLKERHYVKIGDVGISAYFSPEDNIERIIIDCIKKARSSIHFMAFSFTSDEIGEEVIRSYRSGVRVYGIFEKRGANSMYSEYVKMKIEGIPVKLDKNYHIMHHKVIVIDKGIVVTGSYNFSKNANLNNDENILIVESKEVSKKYLNEFYALYN